MKIEELPTIVREIVGDDALGVVDYTFRRMDIAEEEIAAAKRKSPRATTALHASFCLLCPNEFTRGSDNLYRLHVREILGRVKRGEDVAPGTDAEVAFLLGESTLRAPPAQDLARAYFLVFERLYPEKAKALVRWMSGGLAGEYVPGRPLEIVAEARAKIGKLVGRTNEQLFDSIRKTREARARRAAANS